MIQCPTVALATKEVRLVNSFRGQKFEADYRMAYAGSLPWWRTGLVALPTLTFFPLISHLFLSKCQDVVPKPGLSLIHI